MLSYIGSQKGAVHKSKYIPGVTNATVNFSICLYCTVGKLRGPTQHIGGVWGADIN